MINLATSVFAAGLVGVLCLMEHRRLAPTQQEACVVGWLLFSGLVFMILIEIFYGDNSLANWLAGIARWFWAFSFIVLWLAFRFCPHLLRWLLYFGAALTIALLTSVIFHVSGLAFTNQPVVYTFDGYHRPHGMLYSPLEAGIVALVGWAWGIAWAVQQGWRLAAGMTLLGLSIAVMYLTFSRSAWLGFAVATGIGLYCCTRFRRLIIPMLISICFFVVSSVVLPEGWLRSAYATQGDPSVHNRLAMWQQIPSYLWHYPLGTPTDYEPRLILPGDCPLAPMPISTTVNFYLDMGVHFGILPMIILLWLSAALAWRTLRLCVNNTLGVAWGMGTLAVMVCLVFMNPLWDAAASALFGGLWGMVSAMEVKPDATTRVHAD